VNGYVNWLIFVVTGVKKGTLNVGLSEIAVFKAPGAAKAAR